MWCAWSTRPGSSLSFPLCLWGHGYYARVRKKKIVLIPVERFAYRSCVERSEPLCQWSSSYYLLSTADRIRQE
ncbi:hypothetical protein BDV41DRAFT_388582 [Aspergillus transmontanensis]|uniref:Uncharacterized protein n=1 Tax=Aspergillus transmontanensis TaxID=1034304 RepID=A0A5N6VQJ6_9EURO|nr:hypothetical protein BDV41DRAFT_388582 [Aspergillus transmontanensis]